jgi:pSer/pThr/pTyr-binding forkhead associated (FHA) protein
VIGRSRECDIVLEDAGVSRRHAELRPLDASAWSIEDLGSTNGVQVNGRTVQGEHELRSGDRIELGSTEIVFEIAP